MPINSDPNELERQLRAAGFRRTYVWHDGPDTFYDDHTHAVDTAHIILDGEMTLTCGGSSRSALRTSLPEPFTRPGWDPRAAVT